MAEETPPPPSPTPPPSPKRPTGPTTWRDAQRRRAGAPSTVQPRQRTALYLVGIILALTGGVVALFWFLQPPPRPHFIALVIDEYSDERIPPAPWAVQDREALSKLGWQSVNTRTSQEGNLLRTRLRDLGKDDQNKDLSPGHPLVIYLRAYAACTDDGGVALLPADARLDNPKTWLPMTEVMALIRDCKIPKRLLLLDLAQPLTDARSGLLGHDVAQRLKPLLEKAIIDDPSLQVLCSCSPGQASLASEELGQSVFVYYLLRGLQGRADGCLAGRKADGTVQVDELVEYVKTQVDRWAWNNRGVRQVPEMINPREDFALTVAGTPPPVGDAPLPDEYPEKLKKAWEDRDGWWDDTAQRTKPEVFRRFDAALLRAERRWRGGVPVDRAAEGLALARSAADRAREGSPSKGRGAESLAREIARRGKKPDVNLNEMGDKLRALADKYAANPKAGSDEEKKLKEDQAALVKEYKERPFDLAWAVWQTALDEPRPSQAYLKFWVSLLPRDRAKLPAYEEVEFLRGVADWNYNPATPDAWPGEVIALAMKLTREEAERPDPIDKEFEPWVEERLERSRKLGEQGREKKLWSVPSEWDKAIKLLGDALADAREASGRLAELAQARRNLDEALVLLPESVGWVERGPRDREKDWSEALTAATAVRLALEKPPKNENEAAEKMGGVKQGLRDKLDKLRQPLSADAVGRLIKQREGGGLDDAMKMRALLETPRLRAGRRAALWSAWQPLADRLNRQTLERELKPGPVSDPPPPLNLNTGLIEAAERGLLRARLSSQLLLLYGAGKEDLDRVEKAYKDAERDKERASPAVWQALSQAQRAAWAPLREWAAP
jgi:hypothetical protein